MINERGGINGRKLNFITLDDAYSPPKTVEVTRRLVEQDEVLLDLQHAGDADQHRHPEVPEREEGAAPVPGDGCDQVE
jgi:hypothetical protein